MTKFLLRRLVYLVALVIVASSFTYLLAAVALNPRSNYEGRNPPPPAAVVTAALNDINANPDTPLLKRYATWANGVIHGDLGKTIHGGSVNEEISRRLWVSLRLLLIGSILGSLAGVAAGAYGAVKQYGISDHAMTVASFVILSAPTVVIAIFVKDLGIDFNRAVGHIVVYTTGEYTPGIDHGSFAGIMDRLQHLILPSIVLTLLGFAFYGRYQRSAMLDVLGSDFLRTAQAKGLRRTRALIKHALRTALIPMGTFFAYQFALLFTGAVFTETIFSWNGMGKWLVETIRSNDVNGTAAIALVVAVFVMIAGFLSDVVTAALDPRVRRS
jgi:peptide/nickel transport system permease protein